MFLRLVFDYNILSYILYHIRIYIYTHYVSILHYFAHKKKTGNMVAEFFIYFFIVGKQIVGYHWLLSPSPLPSPCCFEIAGNPHAQPVGIRKLGIGK